MTYNVDDRVMTTTDRWGTYNVPSGTLGTVERASRYGETLVNFDGGVRLYVNDDDLAPADPLTMPLDTYKRFVVRKMWAAKEENGWCESAEYLARQMGLSALLPSYVTVERRQVTNTLRWPGEEDAQVIRRANSADTSRWYRNEVEQITDERPQDEGADPSQWEGETVEEFRERLRATAVEGARTYGVSGVEEFLASVGIDCGPITRTVTASVTVSVEVEVPIGSDDAAEEAAERLREAGYTVESAYAD